MASTIGTKKHRDFPDPVPVVTTKLCPALALATGWPLAEIETIDVYRGSQDIYIFPNRAELISAAPAGFSITFNE